MEKNNCNICSCALEALFNFGDIYISNFIPADAKSKDYPKSELCMMYCPNCKSAQLRKTIDPDLLYKDKYWYYSGINQTMKDALSDIAKQHTRIKTNDGDVWLDIACNDGTLLSYVHPKFTTVGCDPSDKEIMVLARQSADIVVNDYFSAEVYNKNVNKRPKIVTCIAMFYDLVNPVQFVQDVYDILEDDGMFILQLSYTPLMLAQMEFGNICAEHVMYHTMTSLHSIMCYTKFKIVDCELNDVNGGSIRLYCVKDERVYGSEQKRDVGGLRVLSLLEYEAAKLDKSNYDSFFNKLLELRLRAHGFASTVKDWEGKKMYAYGACHSEDTNIVTQNGIKKINEISKEDKIYSLNLDTHEVELSNIDDIIQYNYTGDMINFYGKRIDQLVTPNHKILHESKFTNKLKLTEADILKNKYIWYLPKSSFNGKLVEKFLISDHFDQNIISNKARKIPNEYNINDMMYIYGLFIGDGYCSNQSQGYSINFCIPINDKARQPLVDCLNRMNLLYRSYDNEIHVASIALYNIFLECGKNALEKQIPRWILEYHVSHLRFLLNGLVDSDGWYEKNNRIRICSSSKKLIKDIIELTLKLGYFPSITIRKNKTTKIKNRIINSKQGYIVNISKTQPSCNNNKIVKYNGLVWCLSTKNKNFLVERNGKISFSGNSTKGNMMLQYFGLTKEFIGKVADRNPQKWGLKTIGTEIPICSEEEMRADKPDFLLILPWYFIEEFKKREADYLANGGKFIVPCPEFKII